MFVNLSGSRGSALSTAAERDASSDLLPHWIAMFAFAEALVVPNLASGHPWSYVVAEVRDVHGLGQRRDDVLAHCSRSSPPP